MEFSASDPKHAWPDGRAPAVESCETSMRMSPCILGTVCVPWTEAGALDEALFVRAIHHLINEGLSNLYIFGTAGEGYAVDTGRFRKVAEVFLREMEQGGKLAQVGVIGLSVAQVREHIDMAVEMGCRSFQMSFPSWGCVSDIEMHRFFDDILGAYPDCTFLHYNLLRSLRKISGEDYAAVIARHPNLVATKSSNNTPAQLLSLMRQAPELCHFTTEQDFALASGFGSPGLLISTSSLQPARARRFFEAARAGDAQALREATLELNTLNGILIESMCSKPHMDGAYDKLFLKAVFPEFPLRLLSPYEGAAEADFFLFMDKLRQTMPQWMPVVSGDT